MEKNIFLPNVFGPKLWSVIHIAAAAYPMLPTENEIEEMKHFVVGIPATIPCGKCKEDTRNFIRDIVSNETFNNRETLFKFTVDLHNHVNRKLNKAEITVNNAKKLWGMT
jgi:hypothetical protein